MKRWWKGLAVSEKVMCVLVAAALIFTVFSGRHNSNTAFADEPKPAVPHVHKIDKFDAYGMGCEFLRRQHPSAANFHIAADECVDYDNNKFTIVGTVDLPSGSKRWACDIDYTPSDEKWQLERPIAIMGE